ncbi:MAG: glutathione transferase GstA [Burkholderiaceae bacterium]
MKLYYSPGACSLTAHIALKESGLAFEAVTASTKTHKLADGTDYYSINPLGYVPLLELDDGTRLTEVSAIVQYIADQAPAKNLAPANGSLPRYQLQSWLNFIGTELHAKFGLLFNPATPQEVKNGIRERMASRLQWVEGELAGKSYLMGETFSVADAYLFTVSNWARLVALDIAPYANLAALRARVGARLAVLAAMTDEGLIKATT